MSDLIKQLRYAAQGELFGDTLLEEAADRIAELESGRWTSKHYGLYGTACLYTGQLDAGPCWKCQIKKLEAKLDELQTAINTACNTIKRQPLDRVPSGLMELWDE